MTFLFDTGTQPRPQRRRLPGPPEQPAAVEFETAGYSAVTIGRLDDRYECAGGCGCWGHDILDEAGGEWRIECIYCGTRQLVPAEKRDRPAGVFVMNGGRHDGLTFDEIAEKARGVDYIEWAAKEHGRGAVREAAKLWLTNRRQVN